MCTCWVLLQWQKYLLVALKCYNLLKVSTLNKTLGYQSFLIILQSSFAHFARLLLLPDCVHMLVQRWTILSGELLSPSWCSH